MQDLSLSRVFRCVGDCVAAPPVVSAWAIWLTVGAGVIARLGGSAVLAWEATRSAEHGGGWIAVAVVLGLLGAWLLFSALILAIGLAKYGGRERLGEHS